MDYETNCKGIICKKQMLNAYSVFSRDGVYTQSFTHMLKFTLKTLKTKKKYYQLPTFLILAFIEPSPFHMQNTQKEYAPLLLTVHICHTFPIHAYLFYKHYDLIMYVLSLAIMTSFFLFP